jgi:hypothetical protein
MAMKKYFLFLSLVISMTCFQSLKSKIENSHHDFGGRSWTNNEVCIVCHTPHNAQFNTAAPLWNHQLTNASYTVYSSTTLNATVGQPSGQSKICLSCHDGTVAMDNHSGKTDGTVFISHNRAWLSNDLSSDHPISFAYNSSLASIDNGLHDPSTTASGLGGTIERDMLHDGKMECSTCHDVHIGRNTSGCAGCHGMHMGGLYKETLSLRKSNTRSALCLTCHKK